MYLDENRKQSEVRYNTISAKGIVDIHLGSLNILEEIGMAVYHEEAVKLLKNAGADVRDGKQVFIKPSLVNWAVKSASDRIVLYDRDEQPAMFLEKDQVYYGTGSDTEVLVDFTTGKRIKWTKALLEDGIRLSDYLKNIDFIMSMGMLSDVGVQMNTREQYGIMLRKSKKPQVIGCYEIQDLKDVMRMAVAVRGSEEDLQRKPLFLLYCEPTSPLRHSYHALDRLLFAAENKIPTNYAAGGMAGATTPVTPGGTLVLNNAECLLGLVVHQLKSPGAPFVYGFGNAPLDMWTMQPAYATPLAIQISGGMCDLARFYGLPAWGEAGNSCAKICDLQAIMEASQFILMAALQGCQVAHDVGYLDSGLAYSFEFLLICDEIIDRTRRIFHQREDEQNRLPEYLCSGAWERKDFIEVGQQAHFRVKEILAKHYPKPLSVEVDAEVEKILAEARKRG